MDPINRLNDVVMMMMMIIMIITIITIYSHSAHFCTSMHLTMPVKFTILASTLTAVLRGDCEKPL